MLNYPEIDPVLFSIGFIKIRWYGLMYVVGFQAAWLLARRRAGMPWSPVKPEQVDDMIFYGMLGVILGGRLGYVFVYGLDELARDPLYIFKITQGGMSFHGGLAGVIIAMWWYGRKLGRRIFDIGLERGYFMPTTPGPAIVVHSDELRLRSGTLRGQGIDVWNMNWK